MDDHRTSIPQHVATAGGFVIGKVGAFVSSTTEQSTFFDGIIVPRLISLSTQHKIPILPISHYIFSI